MICWYSVVIKIDGAANRTQLAAHSFAAEQAATASDLKSGELRKI